jgi:predicted sulfurtransferase
MIRSGCPFRPGKKEIAMPTCKECENEADKLVSIKVEGKAKKMCEDCADRVRETAEIAEESESVVQNMMGFKGRR